MYWRCSNSLVPVTVVKVYGTKVSDQVDDEEDTTLTRLHGKITSLCISFDGMTSRSSLQRIVHSSRRSKNVVGSVRGKGEKEDDDQNDNGVDPISDEGRFDATEHGVQDDTNGKEETSCDRVHACQVLDDGTATCEKHGCNQNVGHETEGDEDSMRNSSVAGADGLEKH